MEFKQIWTAFLNGYKQYVNFKGEAGIEEYTNWTIAMMLSHLLGVVISLLCIVAIGVPLFFLWLLLLIANIIPNVAISFRHFRAAGKNEWLALYTLLPGALAIQVLYCILAGKK